MIKQGIIEVFAQIPPGIALTPTIFFANEFERRFFADALNLLNVLNAPFHGAHQSDMKSVIQYFSKRTCVSISS